MASEDTAADHEALREATLADDEADHESSDRAAGEASAQRAVEGLAGAARLADTPAPSVTGTATPPLDLTAAAFFDVDNTLVQGSSLVHFGRGLAARKYFRYGDVWKFIYAQAKFQLTGKENSADVAEGRRKAAAPSTS